MSLTNISILLSKNDCSFPDTDRGFMLLWSVLELTLIGNTRRESRQPISNKRERVPKRGHASLLLDNLGKF